MKENVAAFVRGLRQAFIDFGNAALMVFGALAFAGRELWKAFARWWRRVWG
jgi:hypothetical protein